MSLLIAILLGAVQGLTEFLPVSSSGHLTLVSKIFGVQNDVLLINVLLHFATLFAVVYVFRARIWEMIKHPFSSESIKLYIATIPTVLIVLLFKSYLGDYFESSRLLPYGFLATAILLLFTYFLTVNKEYTAHWQQINKKSAFLMGVAQGFAVLPGISRSGSTICTGLLAGEKREETTRFSFIMSIPVIIASLIYEFITADISAVAQPNMIAPLIFAFITAFIVGTVSIRFMLKIMKNAKFYWFSIYLFAIAIASFFMI